MRKTAIRVMVEDSWSKETDKNEEPVSAKFRAMVVTRRHFWWRVTNWIRPREPGWRVRPAEVTISLRLIRATKISMAEQGEVG